MRMAHSYSSNLFRSSDLGVMSPARFHCAMLLEIRPALDVYDWSRNGHKDHVAKVVTHLLTSARPLFLS